MHNYAADPEGQRERQVDQVLTSVAGAIGEDGRPRLCAADSEEAVAVRVVFPRILKAAREEVRLMAEDLRLEMAKQPWWSHKGQLEKVRRAEAQLRLWRDDGFLVLDVNGPNAFVHALVPRVIFVQRGLFWRECSRDVAPLLSHDGGAAATTLLPSAIVPAGKRVLVRRREATGVEQSGQSQIGHVVSARGSLDFDVRFADGRTERISACDMQIIDRHEGLVQSDEQLAMLLGHELSHIIHDHAEDTATLIGVTAGCQLVLLALLDPTGLLSFCTEFGMGVISRYAFQLPGSRANELQADATGLRICARALYDPRDASTFFSRLLEHEAASGEAATWASSHPRTEDRVRALLDSEAEAVRVFETSSMAADTPPRRAVLSRAGEGGTDSTVVARHTPAVRLSLSRE